MAKIEGHPENTVDDLVLRHRATQSAGEAPIAEEHSNRGRPPADQTLKALREQVQTLEQKVALLAETVQLCMENPLQVIPDPKPNNGVVPGLDAFQAALRDDLKFRSDVLLKAELIDQKVGGHLQQFVIALGAE